ncbi:MAG TPA: 4-alpha-glucanotransferase [Candidatus Polarisedimenticolaceae bacterium]
MASRSAGFLLHPTSLPGPFGIGDLGPAADRMLDWAASAGFRVWQTLPLGPTGLGDAPYACLSAFAGNPRLISLERLVEDGLLDAASVDASRGPEGAALHHAAAARKDPLLHASWEAFRRGAAPHLRGEFDAFVGAEAQDHWLDDWCLFAALKRENGDRAWLEWDAPIRRHDPAAVDAARRRLSGDIDVQRWLQFLFFRQWDHIRGEANRRGIRVMGDLPIYLALDSVDVWARQDLFRLDEEGRPTVVSGVPPDYFSATGQLWGNPIYRWDLMERDGFSWWIHRMRQNARLADLVRIDHFRGFAAFWEVPAGSDTAIPGYWVPAPGHALFSAIRGALGDFPIVAEDLGLITPDVHALRDAFGFPGMRVLQFGFDAIDGIHLPHHWTPATVAYTGTHDNNTMRGWFEAADPEHRARALDYTGGDERSIVEAFVRVVYASVASLVVIPAQDAFDLGAEARMNVPGKMSGNWQWRATSDLFRDDRASRLRRLSELTGRLR